MRKEEKAVILTKKDVWLCKLGELQIRLYGAYYEIGPQSEALSAAINIMNHLTPECVEKLSAR